MQTVDQQFFNSLFSNPSSQSPTVMDEMYASLGSENQAIARSAQMVGEIHGPYNGSSPILHQFYQKRTDGIKNIDLNQRKLENYTKNILDLSKKIIDLKDKLLVQTEQIKFLDIGNELQFNLDELNKILTTEEFIKTIQELYELLPYQNSTYTKTMRTMANVQETMANILKEVNVQTPNISNTLAKYYNFSFYVEQLVEEANELSGSKALNSYLQSMKKHEKTYENLLKNSESGLAELTERISNTKSLINRVNNTSSALFDTPLLREFVSHAQNLHPAVTSIIQQNIDQFPYFQQISEKIGSFYTITSSINSIDPMQWLRNDPHDFMTNNILRGQTQPKLFGGMANMVTNSDGYLNTLFLRNTPETHMGFVHEKYSQEKPLAHGYSGTYDTFHAQRALNAKAEILPRLLAIVQDKIRLLDSYFPVVQAVQSVNNYFFVPVEKTEQLVNVYNRPADKPELNVNKVLGTRESDFDGGRDNETAKKEDSGKLDPNVLSQDAKRSSLDRQLNASVQNNNFGIGQQLA